MATETAIGKAFERAGLHERDVKLNKALAEFFNNGGTAARAREIVEAAIGKLSGGGHTDRAENGLAKTAPARQPNESGGPCRVAEKANNLMPSLSPERSGVGHPRPADKANSSVPRPASTAYLAAAKAGAQAIAITVLDTWKIRDGRAIGKVRIGELAAISATNRMEASILDQIKQHVGGADHSATVSDVISVQMLQRFIQRAAEVSDAA